jgi:hypothetical protein
MAGLLAAAIVSACSDDKSTGPKTPVAASIVLSGGGSAIPVEGTTQFTAVVKDADGNVIDVTPTWSVIAGGGTISNTGLFTAGDSAGTYTNTVKATSGSISSTSSVTIDAGALATLTVSPTTVSLAAGATQQYTAVGKDAHGNTISISPTWSVVGGGTVDTAGLFTAGTTAGEFAKSVVATSGEIADSASVTVTAGPLASIVLTPTPAEVAVAATQQFTAVGKDANDNVVDIPTPVWSVEANGGTIDASTGLFTAGTVAGTFTNTVKLTSGDVSATSSVTVTPGPLTNIVLTPPSASLAAGAQQQFTAAGTDTYGNAVTISPTWQAVSGGTITDDGLFTAGNTTGTFTGAVIATVGELAQVANVTVTPGALFSITVSPSNPTVNEGSNRTFTAVGKDVHGNVVTITPTWSIASGNSAAGTIGSSNGIFHAANQTHDHTYVNAIVATANGVSGHTSVTVNDF